MVGNKIKLLKKIKFKNVYLYNIMYYVLMKYYPDNVWICGDTYESLIWNDKTNRQQLRDFPALWVEGTPYPEKPE